MAGKAKLKDLSLVPAHYDQYLKFSRLSKRIFSDYSDRCESFGLGESWLDLTGCTHLFGVGKAVAIMLRRRVKEELGLTASICVSFTQSIGDSTGAFTAMTYAKKNL